MPLDLAPNLLFIVKDILKQHVPDCVVWVFGSRATDRAKQFSDLDLAIVAPEPVSARRMAILSSAFEDSDLPIRVDLVDIHSVSPEFQRLIMNQRELIQST